VVDGEQARGRRVMVFCNTLDSCRAAEHSLREAGAATLCYHGDIPLDGRRAAIAAFTAEAAAPGAPAKRPALVCTDLAARCARPKMTRHTLPYPILTRGISHHSSQM